MCRPCRGSRTWPAQCLRASAAKRDRRHKLCGWRPPTTLWLTSLASATDRSVSTRRRRPFDLTGLAASLDNCVGKGREPDVEDPQVFTACYRTNVCAIGVTQNGLRHHSWEKRPSPRGRFRPDKGLTSARH